MSEPASLQDALINFFDDVKELRKLEKKLDSHKNPDGIFVDKVEAAQKKVDRNIRILTKYFSEMYKDQAKL